MDDDSDGRKICTLFLKRAGYICVEAADGVEAVRKAFTLAPDLVVMDLQLPRLDGWAATRALKADPRTADTPVVALTGHVFPRHRDAASAAGCDAFLAKPVHFSELLETIVGLLGGSVPSSRREREPLESR
ncbi:MAG: response regulator [Polyangiaceae bacterium]